MVDLRRFPVSDEFISDRYTFCTIFDRKHFLDFLNYWFWENCHVTTEHMEMSGIAVRIEWKHFRIPAGPSFGRNMPLKSRNLGFADYGTFFQSLGKFEKWENQKKYVTNVEQTFSERMEAIWGQSVAWRSRYVWKTSKSSAKSARGHHLVPWISHFRSCEIWTVGAPDLYRATRNDGPG